MSKLKVTTIANVADSESTDVTNVINGSAKAWVNFNGTGTVAIRQSFNVSSITDNGTGDYSINFTSSIASGNGCVVAMGVHDNGSYVTQPFLDNDNVPLTTTRARLNCLQPNNLTSVDGSYLSVAVFV